MKGGNKVGSIVPIVEGDGEIQAVPNLLKRIPLQRDLILTNKTHF